MIFHLFKLLSSKCAADVCTENQSLLVFPADVSLVFESKDGGTEEKTELQGRSTGEGGGWGSS